MHIDREDTLVIQSWKKGSLGHTAASKPEKDKAQKSMRTERAAK